MHPPTDQLAAPTPARFLATVGLALMLAGGCAAVVVSVTVWIASPAACGAASLGAAAAIFGAVAGLAALGAGMATPIERGFLVVGASIIRAIAALAAGLLVQRATGAPLQPFWFSFLLVIACVLAAEVAITRRLLDTPHPSESARP